MIVQNLKAGIPQIFRRELSLRLRVPNIPYWIRRRLKRLSALRFLIGRRVCRSASISWHSRQTDVFLNIIPIYIYGRAAVFLVKAGETGQRFK